MSSLVTAFGLVMFLVGAWLGEPWWKFFPALVIGVGLAVAVMVYHYYLVDKAMQRCGGD